MDAVLPGRNLLLQLFNLFESLWSFFSQRLFFAHWNHYWYLDDHPTWHMRPTMSPDVPFPALGPTSSGVKAWSNVARLLSSAPRRHGALSDLQFMLGNVLYLYCIYMYLSILCSFVVTNTSDTHKTHDNHDTSPNNLSKHGQTCYELWPSNAILPLCCKAKAHVPQSIPSTARRLEAGPPKPAQVWGDWALIHQRIKPFLGKTSNPFSRISHDMELVFHGYSEIHSGGYCQAGGQIIFSH